MFAARQFKEVQGLHHRVKTIAAGGRRWSSQTTQIWDCSAAQEPGGIINSISLQNRILFFRPTSELPTLCSLKPSPGSPLWLVFSIKFYEFLKNNFLFRCSSSGSVTMCALQCSIHSCQSCSQTLKWRLWRSSSRSSRIEQSKMEMMSRAASIYKCSPLCTGSWRDTHSRIITSIWYVQIF